MKFISQNAKENKPFFCYIPLATPHSPMQVPDKYWDRHKDKPFQMEHKQNAKQHPHTRAAHAMVENIDDNVGRVLKQLDELELTDNTIVIYFSDNGPNGARWNGGMKGKKGSVDEGGLRSAMFMRWPAQINEGLNNVLTTRMAAIDLYPTLIDLAQIERVGDKPFDGKSLAWDLLNKVDPEKREQFSRRLIFSHQRGKLSVRSDQFRLGWDNKLYDMRKDPGQTKDVSAAFPETFKELKEALAAWKEDIGLNQKSDPQPFTVGHADWPVTELPARDATTNGSIKRSSIHPNCSYFLNWSDTADAILWDIEVLAAGKYEALVYYACPAKDLGSTLRLSFKGATAVGTVNEVNAPPLEGKEENKIDNRESYVKDFKPMSLGVIELSAGRGEMSLVATEIPGGQALEFRRLMLRRVTE